MGIHQLRKLEGFIRTRQKYASLFDEAFKPLPQISIPLVKPDRNHIYHLYVIRLSLEQLTIDRAAFIEELRTRDIGTSVHFIPVHLHPFYREHFGYRKGQFPSAEGMYEQIVSLPLYPAMSESDVHDVISAVYEVCSSHRR
jgi:dTDP-4-amino-4,6-dideoxygalactose transaminase